VRVHPDGRQPQLMTTPDTCYRLVVAGRLSQTVVQLIDSQFGSAASVGRSGRDSTVHLTADQPALRALATLLWDLGHDLIVLGTCADRSQQLEGRPCAHRPADLRVQSRLAPAVPDSTDLSNERTSGPRPVGQRLEHSSSPRTTTRSPTTGGATPNA
jgi:hypothetical protein